MLVTGAGAGIGRGVATRASAAGACVVVADIDVRAGEETLERLAPGAESAFFEVDTSNAAQVRELIAKTVATFGRLDCAVNNVGVGFEPMPLLETTAAELDRVLAVNLKGTWWCVAYEARAMQARKAGAIVNIGSVLGLRARPGHAAYGASKAALIHFTKVAARELAADGIRVNVVCPGPIATETSTIDAHPDLPRDGIVASVPLGRLGEVGEVAETAVWLASDQASFVTAAVLTVDGGESS